MSANESSSSGQSPSQEPVFQSTFLHGKKGLIVGVANRRSIAWASALSLDRHGAELAFTCQGERVKTDVEELLPLLGKKSCLYPCDVTRDEELQALGASLERDFGRLDFLIHCVAFAPKEEMKGRLLDGSRWGFHTAMDVSAYSLIALAKVAAPLFEKSGGGSMVALTYLGAERVIPNYNVMGVAKAGLESAIRYLAYDLGRRKIRVNGVSAGPVRTLAARGISDFNSMLETHRNRAPLGRNVEMGEIAETVSFLAGPLASGITGEILYVDCGYHIMGV